MSDAHSICNHAIGSAEESYHREAVHVDDWDENGIVRFGACFSHFSAYSYCPYCGEDILELAKQARARIHGEWDVFWKQYGDQHGEAELQRALAKSSRY